MIYSYLEHPHPDNKLSEIDSASEQQIQITESSWIDWDDKKKLETHVLRQKNLEYQKGFDPEKYFGGLRIFDLNQPPDDPRFEGIFPHNFL